METELRISYNKILGTKKQNCIKEEVWKEKDYGTSSYTTQLKFQCSENQYISVERNISHEPKR